MQKDVQLDFDQINRINTAIAKGDASATQHLPSAIDVLKCYTQLPESEKTHTLFNEIKPLINFVKTQPPTELNALFFETLEPAHVAIKSTKLPISPKIAFHLLADLFGTNSSLQGESIANIFELVIVFLEKNIQRSSDFERYGLSQTKHQELLALLKQARELNLLEKSDSAVKDWRDSVEKKLANKESILLPGGWVGKPIGHAVFYHVLPDPTSSDYVFFRVFNRGAGSDKLTADIVDNKLKTPPYCEWRVKKSRLLHPDTFTALIELRTLDSYKYNKTSSVPIPTNFNENDVYEALKNILGEALDSDESANRMTKRVTSQRSGTCAWKSLCAFLSTYFEDPIYKRFLFDIKLNVLESALSLPDDPQKALLVRVIKNGSADFSIALNNAFKSGVINANDLIKAQTTLQKAQEWISAYKPKESDPINLEEVTLRVPKAKRIFPLEKVIGEDPPLIEQIKNPKTEVKVDLIHLRREIETLSFAPKTVLSSLDFLVSNLKKIWEIEQDTFIYHTIQDVSLKLPLELKFWELATLGKSQNAEHAICQLNQLAFLVFKTYFTIPYAFERNSEELHGLLRILKVQEHLLKIRAPQFASICPLINSSGLHSLQNSFWNFDESKISASFISFENASAHPTVAQIVDGPVVEKNASIGPRIGIVSHGGGDPNYYSVACTISKDEPIFISEIIQFFPEIVQAIPNFSSLNPIEQYAQFWIAPETADWVKAIRDSQLIMKWLREGPLGSTTIPRDQEVAFQYKLKGNYLDKTEYDIHLTTVDLIELSKNHPEIWTSLAFESSYHKFTDPALRTFLKNMGRLRQYSYQAEKALLSRQPADFEIPFPTEEFRELGQVILNLELQIPLLMDYFLKNPTLLENPDYQTLFRLLLFDLRLIDLEIEKDSHFPDKIQRFFEVHLHYCLQNNNVQTYVFLCQMGRKLACFKDRKQQPLLPEFSSKKHEFKLFKLLDASRTTAQERSLIWAEWIASKKSEDLGHEDIEKLLMGILHLGTYPIPAEWREPMIHREVEQSVILHLAHIGSHFAKLAKQDLDPFLNSLVKVAIPGHLSTAWQQVDSSQNTPLFMTKENSLLLDPIKGKVIKIDSVNPMPLEYSSKLFKRLFPEILEGFYHKGDIYEFTDKHGVRTLAKPLYNGWIIDQFRDQLWMRLTATSCWLTQKKDWGMWSDLYRNLYLPNNNNVWMTLWQ